MAADQPGTESQLGTRVFGGLAYWIHSQTPMREKDHRERGGKAVLATGEVKRTNLEIGLQRPLVSFMQSRAAAAKMSAATCKQACAVGSLDAVSTKSRTGTSRLQLTQSPAQHRILYLRRCRRWEKPGMLASNQQFHATAALVLKRG